MKQGLCLLITLLAALTLQATVLDYLRVAGVKPDIVLIVIIFNSFRQGSKNGALWGFAAGLLVDIFSGGYFGLNALSLAAAGYLAGEAKTGLYLNSNTRVAAVTLAVSLAAGVFQYLLLAFSGVFVSPWLALGVIVPGAVYNTVAALLIKFFYHPKMLFDR
ncbi:MAG: Rod shape-determining protein MreD [Desulfotomaculum sp. 46_296]|nr:MAG: Rod shape-determining protein MreD [Desulfotomaculum sp. 46_296]HAU32355.1 rod shape-determining protein MreD [Desulfotomaculum sp.]